LYDDLQALAQNGVVRVENDHTEDKTRITLVDMAKANAMLGYGTVRARLKGSELKKPREPHCGRPPKKVLSDRSYCERKNCGFALTHLAQNRQAKRV
jgi:hypothetical protein